MVAIEPALSWVVGAMVSRSIASMGHWKGLVQELHLVLLAYKLALPQMISLLETVYLIAQDTQGLDNVSHL